MQPDEPAKKKIATWKIVLGVIVGITVLGALVPEPTPEQIAAREAKEAEKEQLAQEKQAAAALAKLDEAIVLTSRQLAGAYETNEVAAQREFKGQSLLVSGRVQDIVLDFADDAVVLLPGVNDFLRVQVELNDQDAAAQLRDGQDIRVLCNRVSEVIGAPMLSDCELVE